MDIENITILKADISHMDAVAVLFDLYRQFYKQPADLGKARDFIRQRIAKGESVVFLAFLQKDGETVAAGFAQLYPSYSSAAMQRTWILNDLYVVEEFRKKGIARQLMKTAKEHGVKTGSKRLSLMTARDNFPAQSLYVSEGWREEKIYLAYTLDL